MTVIGNIVVCDWPQCECDYECERQDKHKEYVKETEELEPAAPHSHLTKADVHLGSMLDEWDRLSNDERGQARSLFPSFVGRLEALKSAIDRSV